MIPSMTPTETADNLRQGAARLDEYVPAYRVVLATVLARRDAYLPGAAEAHVDALVGLVAGARERAAGMRAEATRIEATLAAEAA